MAKNKQQENHHSIEEDKNLNHDDNKQHIEKNQKRKRIFLFFFFMGIVSTSIQILQYFTLPLLLYSHYLFRKINTLGVAVFCSNIVVLTWLIAPIELILSGDYKDLLTENRMLLMANHQIYTDWWYIWILSWYCNRQYYVKIILKESLKFLPIFGPGMMFFEFIFLKRKWVFDKVTLWKAVQKIRSDKLPFWLILFPEGTVITEDTKGKSQRYAQKVGWKEQSKLVLHPKITGTYFICKYLKESLSSVYDVTMAYSGLKVDDCPYDCYPIKKVFFEGKGPRRVYMHVQKFTLNQIPGFKDSDSSSTPLSDSDNQNSNHRNASSNTHEHSRSSSFSNSTNEFACNKEKKESQSEQLFGQWLRSRFMEKDELLQFYHQHGQFPDTLTATEARTIENQKNLLESLSSASQENKLNRDSSSNVLVIQVVPNIEDWFAIIGTVYFAYYVSKFIFNFIF